MRIELGLAVALLAIIAGFPAAATSSCPAGSYMIMDNMGLEHCEWANAKPAVVERAMNGGCPPGSRPWRDSWGNNTCRSNESLSGFGRPPAAAPAWQTPGPPRVPGPPGFN